MANLGVTLFGGYYYDGVSAGVWVIHSEMANLGVKLFDSYSYDGVGAGIWVIHIEGRQIWVQDGWSRFLTVTLMMVRVLVYGSYI